MKKYYYLALALVLCAQTIVGQSERKRANYWYYGSNAALNFSCPPPTSFSGSPLSSLEGSAAISDLNGNLLMFTNGTTVWDANHNVMPNGTGLLGNQSTVQPAVIVPHPGNPDRYFIFTAGTSIEDQGTVGVRFSEVDMTLNGGMGDVLPATKNTLLFAPNEEKLTAVKDASGTGYWVAGQKKSSNEWYVYHVTAAGVNMTPVISVTGPQARPDNSLGAKFSPDGTMLITQNVCGSGINSNANFTLYSFDNATGVITFLWDDCGVPAFHLEFSPDCSKIYTSATSGVFQYDLSAGASIADGTAIKATRTQIATGNHSLQLANDCKIYVGNSGNTLGVIANPNLPGTSCNYIASYITLISGTNQQQFPNFVQSFFDNNCENLDFDLTATNAGCDSDGSIISTINQGIPPFTYQWSNGATTPNISDLSGGWYSVIITDGNGCSLEDSAFVSQPPSAAVTNQILTPPNPCGSSTGAIDLTIETVGGSPELIVEEDFETDGNGTRYTLVGAETATSRFFQRGNALNFTQPVSGQNNSYYFGARWTSTLPAILTLNATTITGYTNLEVCALFASVGTPNVNDYYRFEYSIDGGPWVILKQFRRSGSFPYVLSEDTNNDGIGDGIALSNIFQQFCMPISASGNQITIRVVTNTSSNQSQFAFDNIRLTGIAPQTYSISWSNGATTEDISGVPAGNYTATITSGSCTISENFTLIDLCTLQASFTVSDNSICAGESIIFTDNSNGQNITNRNWTFNGGTPNSASTIGPHTVTFNNPGTYNITLQITDNTSATDDTTIVVTVNALPIATATGPASFCAGDPINLTATGGTSYSWTGPNGFTSSVANPSITSTSATNAGTYTVTVTDANGCTNTAQTTINHFCTSQASFTLSSNSICVGESITFTDASGGGTITGWNWTFNGGTPANAATQGPHTIAFGTAGTYNITLQITDNLGNTDDTTVTVVVHGLPTATANNNGPLCTGATITLTGSGGTSYSWESPNGTVISTNATAQVNNAVLADFGTYTLTVTDANGCSNTATTTVSMGAGPSLTTSNTPASCFGGSDGTANVSATGGVPGYSYSWSPSGATTATVNNLSAGSYTVTVTDAAGCVSQETVVVADGTPIVLDVSSTNSSCAANTGTATVDVLSGGTPGFTYSWSPNGETTSTITNLGVGTYTVTVTDANNCQQIGSVQVSVTNGPSVSLVNKQNITCFGEIDGSITVDVTGGTAPYQYSWSPSGGTGSTASGLAGGSYTVTVTDILGCTDELTVSILEPTEIQIASTVTDENCGESNGAITLTVTGGSGNFSYNWSPAVSTSNTATDLLGGDYDILVTDINGCTQTIQVTVGILYTIPIDVEATPSTIEAGNSTQLTATVDPALVYDSIVWSPAIGLSCTNCENPTASPLETTIYYAIVYTPDGCYGMDSVVVTVKEPCAQLFVANSFSPNGDGNNDLVCVRGTCIKSIDYTVFNRWGEVVFHSTDQSNCWDGMFRGKPVQTGAYVYKLIATLEDGTEIKESGNLHVTK